MYIPAYAAVERKGNVKNGWQPESKGKGIYYKQEKLMRNYKRKDILII